MSWSDRYLEVPWSSAGTAGSFSGCNCYGLVRLIYREEFEIDLPAYDGIGYTKGIESEKELSALFTQERSRWKDVESPQEGDVIWLRVAGNPYHVGVMVSSQEFIHIEEGCGPVVESILSPMWARRIHGYVRW